MGACCVLAHFIKGWCGSRSTTLAWPRPGQCTKATSTTWVVRNIQLEGINPTNWWQGRAERYWVCVCHKETKLHDTLPSAMLGRQGSWRLELPATRAKTNTTNTSLLTRLSSRTNPASLPPSSRMPLTWRNTIISVTATRPLTSPTQCSANYLHQPR